MKTQFRFTRFSSTTWRRIRQAQEILGEYDQKLTVRQLYYQFVARGLLENIPQNYKTLAAIITDARYAGEIAWDAIEDRGRAPDVPSEWETIDELVDIAMKQFRLPRWKDQNRYVELWVEKQALAGVLAPIARRHHVTLMVNKGYSSASAMKDAADRMHAACGTQAVVECGFCGDWPYALDDSGRCTGCEGRTQPKTTWAPQDADRSVTVIYLGDHDPSGEDMVRDIEDRLNEFGVPNLTVKKIALTMAQIRQYNPPPNPAKITDSRAAGYIAKYGASSWELDALPPRVLNALVDGELKLTYNARTMQAVIDEEKKQVARLTKALKQGRQ